MIFSPVTFWIIGFELRPLHRRGSFSSIGVSADSKAALVRGMLSQSRSAFEYRSTNLACVRDVGCRLLPQMPFVVATGRERSPVTSVFPALEFASRSVE